MDEKSKFTCLFFACYAGRATVVAALLQKGADYNHKFEEGMTYLHVAVALGHIDCAKLLVETGIDIHVKDNNGRNALDFAVESY